MSGNLTGFASDLRDVKIFGPVVTETESAQNIPPIATVKRFFGPRVVVTTGAAITLSTSPGDVSHQLVT